VNVKTLDDAGFAAIYRAWLDAKVLVVPDQQLEIDDFLRYSRRFGRIEPHPSKSTRHPDYPEITMLGVKQSEGNIGTLRLLRRRRRRIAPSPPAPMTASPMAHTMAGKSTVESMRPPPSSRA